MQTLVSKCIQYGSGYPLFMCFRTYSDEINAFEYIHLELDVNQYMRQTMQLDFILMA